MENTTNACNPLAGDDSDIYLTIHDETTERFDAGDGSLHMTRSKTFKQTNSTFDNDIKSRSSNDKQSSSDTTTQGKAQDDSSSNCEKRDSTVDEPKASSDKSGTNIEPRRLVRKLFIIGVKHPEVGSKYKASILVTYPECADEASNILYA